MALLNFEHTRIEGLCVISKKRLGDERGSFSRLFCAEEFKNAGWEENICQVNYSKTQKAGTVRGLHFQVEPYSEVKIVNCVKGKIFDVAVDLRPQSPTYLEWESRILSEENWQSFYIPKGVAHGFQTLCDDCDIVYLHSQLYQPDYDRGINPLDPKLAINWPLDISVISERDQNFPNIDSFEITR